MTAEEKKIAVEKYIKANPEPDQDCCPELIQYWDTAKGRVWWSNKTGRRTTYRSCLETTRAWSVRGEYHGVYLKYIDELDALELSYLRIKGNRGVDGVKKSWSYGNPYYYSYYDRMFIFHNDTNVYMVGKTSVDISTTTQKYANQNVLDFGGIYGSLLLDYNIIEKEVQKFAPEFKFKNHWGLYDFKEWYRLSFMPRKTSLKAKEISEYDMSEDRVPQYNTGKYYAYFEILDENYAVIRIFRHTNTRWDSMVGYVLNSGDRQEEERVFISAKGKPTVMKNYSGKWRIVGNTTETWDVINIINIEKIVEWKPLKYIAGCIADDDKDKTRTIITLLRHPIVEMLLKSGYTEIAKRVASGGNVSANIKRIFRSKERKANIYKQLGVNKYTLQKLEATMKPNYSTGYYYNYYSTNHEWIISDIKKVYGMDDISDLSPESIDLVWDIIKGDSRILYNLFGNGGYYHREEVELTTEQGKLFIRLCKINQKSNKNEDVFRIYEDINRLKNTIINMPDINIMCFHNVDEMVRIHDYLVRIKNIEDQDRPAAIDARNKKAFDKQQKERVEKYELTGEKFCIRMPKDLKEIVTEGHILDHCVSGYVNRHAIGETNIIFLRKKDAEDIPFYTIEIRDGRVIQIHGKHNRWLGNDPEAIPFVYEWLKQLGVKFDNKVLLNKGTGYSASHECLPTSYLTAVY